MCVSDEDTRYIAARAPRSPPLCLLPSRAAFSPRPCGCVPQRSLTACRHRHPLHRRKPPCPRGATPPLCGPRGTPGSAPCSRPIAESSREPITRKELKAKPEAVIASGCTHPSLRFDIRTQVEELLHNTHVTVYRARNERRPVFLGRELGDEERKSADAAQDEARMQVVAHLVYRADVSTSFDQHRNDVGVVFEAGHYQCRVSILRERQRWTEGPPRDDASATKHSCAARPFFCLLLSTSRQKERHDVLDTRMRNHNQRR